MLIWRGMEKGIFFCQECISVKGYKASVRSSAGSVAPSQSNEESRRVLQSIAASVAPLESNEESKRVL